MKMLFFSFAILITFLLGTSAQGKRADSINETLSRSSMERSSLLYELSYPRTDADTLGLLRRSVTLITKASENGDSVLLIEGYRKKALILRSVQKFRASVDLLDDAIAMALRKKSDLLRILHNEQGLNYYFLSNYPKALEHYLRSLALCESDGNKAEMSISLNNVALVYYKLRNYDKALEYFNNSLSLKLATKDFSEMDQLLITMGFCYARSGNFPTALKLISEGLSRCGDNCNEGVLLMGDFGLGMIYFNQGNLDKALVHLNKSLTTSKHYKNNRFQVENLLYLAKIYLEQGNLRAVHKALGNAEAIAEQLNYKDLLLDLYDQYSRLYRMQHRYARAVGYQAQYAELRDRLYGEELLHRISALQVEFEARHEEKIIQEQHELLALQERTLHQQRLVNVTIGVVALMLLVILALLFHSYANKKRMNRRLDKLVQAKTLDLEKRHQHLYETNEALQRVLLNTAEQFNGPLATLRGICHVGKMEIQDPEMLEYFEKLTLATDEMAEIVAFRTRNALMHDRSMPQV